MLTKRSLKDASSVVLRDGDQDFVSDILETLLRDNGTILTLVIDHHPKVTDFFDLKLFFTWR